MAKTDIPLRINRAHLKALRQLIATVEEALQMYEESVYKEEDDFILAVETDRANKQGGDPGCCESP